MRLPEKIKSTVLACVQSPHFVLVTLALLCLAVRASSEPDPHVDLSVPPGAHRICVSMKALITMVKTAITTGAPIPSECDVLSGFNYPEGYLVDDRDGPDIVLVGLSFPKRPPLFFDDLVVNVRNLVDQSLPPRCSLDPRKEDVVKWEPFRKDVLKESGRSAAEIVQALHSNLGPQMVIVEGVPRASHHANVMVAADYHMKKVSQGHLFLPGVISYLDHSIARGRALESRANATQIAHSQSRFWFQVRERDLRFSVDDRITWIAKCQMMISTEKQAATPTGELFDSGEDDPDAIAFAKELSAALPKVAANVSDYASLEALFRLRALLLAIERDPKAPTKTLEFSNFFPNYRFNHETNLPPSLEGLVNYREERISKGQYVLQKTSMVAGGVSMYLPLGPDAFLPEITPGLGHYFSMVLRSKPSIDALMWPAPVIFSTVEGSPFFPRLFSALVAILILGASKTSFSRECQVT